MGPGTPQDQEVRVTERGAVWLARLSGGQEAAVSNTAAPTTTPRGELGAPEGYGAYRG